MLLDYKINNQYKKFFNNKFLFIFLSSILFILYLYVASNNYGYDDEFNTINIIENLKLKSMIEYLQSNDIHPPLSYVFDKILFIIFKDWRSIRIFLCVLIVFSIVNLAYKKYKTNGRSLLLLIFLGFDPNILMWATSIRWHTYFIIIISWYLVVPNSKTNWFYIKQFIGLTLLCYIGYISIILIPPLIVYYNAIPIKNGCYKVSKLLLTYLCFIFFYSYQFKVFISVHLQSKAASGNYNFPLPKILTGVISGVFSNQGVMPYSIAGVISIIACTIIFYKIFKNSIEYKQLFGINQIYFFSLTLFVFSGVAGFLRIFVILSPLKALMFSKFNYKGIYKIACILLIISQLQGFSNVITRSGTTKAYWNVPHNLIFKVLEKQKNICKEDLIVLHHDQALSFHLNRKDFISISPFENSYPYISNKNILKTSPFQNKNDLNKILESSSVSCLAVVDTFRGFNGIPYEKKQQLISDVEKLKYKTIENINLGENFNYKLNRLFAKDFPKFRAKITILKNVKNIGEIRNWRNF